MAAQRGSVPHHVQERARSRGRRVSELKLSQPSAAFIQSTLSALNNKK